MPCLWVAGRQWKPLLGCFHWGPIPAVGGLAIPHGQYERCANLGYQCVSFVQLDRLSPYLKG
jgi:hypothetical protein